MQVASASGSMFFQLLVVDEVKPKDTVWEWVCRNVGPCVCSWGRVERLVDLFWLAEERVWLPATYHHADQTNCDPLTLAHIHTEISAQIQSKCDNVVLCPPQLSPCCCPTVDWRTSCRRSSPRPPALHPLLHQPVPPQRCCAAAISSCPRSLPCSAFTRLRYTLQLCSAHITASWRTSWGHVDPWRDGAWIQMWTRNTKHCLMHITVRIKQGAFFSALCWHRKVHSNLQCNVLIGYSPLASLSLSLIISVI